LLNEYILVYIISIMENFAIKLLLPSSRNMNRWFQYYISLGFTTYFIYADITNSNLYNNILFYKKFVKIHINPIAEQLNTLYILELEVDDLLYIPIINRLLTGQYKPQQFIS